MKSILRSGIGSSRGAAFKAITGISLANVPWQECEPTYLIAWNGDTPIASAALFQDSQ